MKVFLFGLVMGAVALAFITSLTGCTIVGPGERGARYTMGKLSDDVLQPGTHLWIPYFAGTSTMDVQIHSYELKTSSGTKDQQEVTTTVTINLQIEAEQILNVVKNFGTDESVIARVLPLVQESINQNVSKYSAEEILTKRSALKADIEALVKEKVARYGVLVHDVSINDLQYSSEYSQAIERKQIAEQKAKQAEYETLQAKQNANAAIEVAKGLAEANRLKLQTLTPQLIQYEAIQKWDGKLSQFMGGSGAVPFINLKLNEQQH